MKLTLRRPDDFHCHFRWDERLPIVLGFTARVFARGLDMPNWKILNHPWVTEVLLWVPGVRAEDVLAHREEILSLCEAAGWNFDPVGCLYITERTTPEDIHEAHAAGIRTAKTYPRDGTTNSGWGIANLLSDQYLSVCDAMERVGMISLIHGELVKSFVMDREADFLSIFEELVHRFPRLKFVLEHITTAAAVQHVERLPSTVAATITNHHLTTTLDDVLGYGLRPHYYCMPVPKRPEDLAALIRAATSGNPKFFFGSDTAPHMREDKESDCGCAGVFSAPVAMPVLVQVFEDADALSRLESFTSCFGAEFYGLPLNKGTITLIKKPWTVPADYDGIVPFRAGEILLWQVEGVDFS